MVESVKGALGEKIGGGGGRGKNVEAREESDECRWSELCANKHLTEHEDLKWVKLVCSNN